MRSVIVAALALVTLTACGSAGEKDDSSAQAPPSDGVKLCGSTVPVPVAADLDGRGSTVTFTSAAGECQARMAVGNQVLELDIDEPITTDQLSALRVPGVAHDLVLYRQDHPRGGFEVRLFGLRGGEPAEITRADGKPLVPFVATDAPTQYVSARCTADGFELVEAVAHQPVGVAAAWDVWTTAFTGADLAAGDRRETADNVLDDQLAQRYPQLTRNALFGNCPKGTA